jgi:poly(hydroxyalkanoate) granule-associated protein
MLALSPIAQSPRDEGLAEGRMSRMAESNGNVVERWFGSVASGKVSEAVESVAPDIKLLGIGPAVSGRASVTFVLNSVRAAFPDLRLDTETLAADGPWVVVRFTASGTQQTEFFGLAGGSVREAHGVCCARVGDAGITELSLYLDAGHFVGQFGLRPASLPPAGMGIEPSESWRDRITGSARDIWLAGLGVLVTAGEQGERVFHTLVEQGRKLESSAAQPSPAPAPPPAAAAEATTPNVAELARRAASTGQQYVRGMAATLRERLDVPTREEFEELRTKVVQLSARTESSAGARPTDAARVAEEESKSS